MIHNVIPTIVGELNGFLKRQFNETEDKVILSELLSQEGSLAFMGENKIVCSLLNIEQERANLNASRLSKIRQNPPINLNLYVVFAAYFPANYVEALKFLSLVIGFFQGKQVFSPNNTPGLSSEIEKITVEMVSLDLHQLSNLWAAMGAKVVPFAVYKLRMLSITRDQILREIPEIRSVDTQLEN